MFRLVLRICLLLTMTISFFLPLNVVAQTRISSASLVSLDFPVPDPLYIYNQFAYVTSHFQRREAGYTANQGHDQFAAYWVQKMTNNLAGFGPQVRRDTFPIHGWRERPASLPAFNMEVTVPGLAHPEQEIIVGCHYDGKANSTESALDDTSGCAYELGVGKAMGDYWRSHHVYPARTVRFVIFDAEEQGLFGSFHYLDSTINGDLPNVLAMFNEEQSGINYPARFLGKASNPFMPDYIDVTPLQDNAAYPGRIHFTPLQRERVIHFRNLWQQAIPAVFAQFQAVGYQSLDYYNSNNQNVSQPIFTPGQQNNVHIQDDPSSNSDQVPFIYAGLPVVTVTGDQSYYDPNPPVWAFPYDLPEDTLALMNTGAGTGTAGYAYYLDAQPARYARTGSRRRQPGRGYQRHRANRCRAKYRPRCEGLFRPVQREQSPRLCLEFRRWRVCYRYQRQSYVSTSGELYANPYRYFAGRQTHHQQDHQRGKRAELLQQPLLSAWRH